MKRVWQIMVVALCLAVGSMENARALEKEAIIRLLREGVSEDTLILIVQRENRQYSLTVDDVVDLRAAGASDRLINAMLGGSALRWQQPAPAADVVIHSATVPKDRGVLLVRNETNQSLTLAWDGDHKNLYLHRGRSSLPSALLAGEGNWQIVLHTGTWDVAWLGQDKALEVKIREGRTSVLTLRTEIDGSIVGVYSYDGVIRDSGVLWAAVDRERERRLQRELERAREAAEDLEREAERLRAERATTIIVERHTRPCPPPPVVVKPFPSHPPVVVVPTPRPPVIVRPYPPPPPPPTVIQPFPGHPPVIIAPPPPPPPPRNDSWSVWFRWDRGWRYW